MEKIDCATAHTKRKEEIAMKANNRLHPIAHKTGSG